MATEVIPSEILDDSHAGKASESSYKRSEQTVPTKFKKNNTAMSTEQNESKDTGKIGNSSYEKILEPGASPLVEEEIVHRSGGDKFLNDAKETQENFNATPPPQSPPPPGNNPPPSGNSSSSNDNFKFVDPEEDYMRKQQAQEHKVQEDFANQSGNLMADMILDAFEMITPEASEAYYRINEAEVRKLELEDKLPLGTLDTVKDVNKSNRNRVKFDSSKKEFLRKPLYKVLEIHSVKSDPTTMLIIAILLILIMIWFESYKVKRENKDLFENLINNYKHAKEEERKKDAEYERQKRENAKSGGDGTMEMGKDGTYHEVPASGNKETSQNS